MKLATIKLGNSNYVGAVVKETGDFLNLAAAAKRAGIDAQPFQSMLALIDAGDKGLDVAADLLSRMSGEADLMVKYVDDNILSPLPEPRQFRDAMSFPQHIVAGPRGMQVHLARERGEIEAAETLRNSPLDPLPDVYKELVIFYITNRFSVRGTGAVVQWPRYSKLMDYELELAIVTKNKGSNILAANAKDHIFGYTIFNDFSARDRQVAEMVGRLGPAKGKSFDGGNVLGPVIVTPDEIGDPYALRMQARVNGDTRCDSDSSGMLRSFEELIEYISEDETIMPGEVIGSGTVGGGCGLEKSRFLSHGDVVELEIEKIGIIRNRVETQSLTFV